jgi:hypothetical protein
LDEGIENTGLAVGGDADAGVGHGAVKQNRGVGRILRHHSHRDLAGIVLSGGCELNGIANQVGQDYVGGYTATSTMGCLVDANAVNPNACVAGTPVTASGQNFTIYFTLPTSGDVTVTYTVFGSGGPSQAASASTTFTVVGPGGQPFAGIASGLGNPGVAVDNNSYLVPPVQAIHYGGTATGPGTGFGFNAPGYPIAPKPTLQDPPNPPAITTPPGFANIPGTLGFLQVVTSQTFTEYLTNGSYYGTGSACIQGLDVYTPGQQNVPYPFYPTVPGWPNQTNDSPDFALVAQVNGNTIRTVGAGGTYNMYLMFQPNTANSIPVPLAVIPWSWSGGATNNAGNWALTFNTGQASPTGSIAGAVTNGVFPVWQSSCPFQQGK